MRAQRHASFWQRYPGLVWSNSLASDSVMIRAALARPQAAVLKEIAEEFGSERLRGEWAIMAADPLESFSSRHRELCDRVLKELRGEELRHAG